jgi:hypothetical protein
MSVLLRMCPGEGRGYCVSRAENFTTERPMYLYKTFNFSWYYNISFNNITHFNYIGILVYSRFLTVEIPLW